MTLLEAIEEAHSREGIAFNPQMDFAELHKMQYYARESMVMVMNRHVYTITRRIVVDGKKYKFGAGEKRPYGRVIVTQGGEICKNTFSRADMDTILVEANDGECDITYKPTPIYPEALSDRIDMPDEYLEEVIKWITLHLRIRRRNEEGGNHEHKRARSQIQQQSKA